VPDNLSRIAIITGATSGIGEATARKFIASAFGVVGNGRNTAKLAALENELGSAFRGVAGDAADSAVLNRLFDEARSWFGRPANIVVVNAGRGLSGSITKVDRTQFDEMLRINVSGALELLQKAARSMLEGREASVSPRSADIVIIGSVAGRHISPFSAAYGATKYAVHALAEGLRREAGPKGVRVTLVEPAVVLSGFQAVAGYNEDTVRTFKEKFGPLLTGADIAEAIYFVVTRPSHVHVSDIIVRPTRQDYP
jgi:NADP-dependent 3-hydroxy acid dehydrogenase YdfG